MAGLMKGTVHLNRSLDGLEAFSASRCPKPSKDLDILSSQLFSIGN